MAIGCFYDTALHDAREVSGPDEEIAAVGIIGDGDVFGNRIVVDAE